MRAWRKKSLSMLTGNNSISYLELSRKEGEPQRHELQAAVILGRSSAAQIVIEHPSVSRKHAEIAPDEQGRWIVRDLESRNGTTVNGASVTNRILKNGDQIGVGEVILRFICETSAIAPTEEAGDAPGFTISSFDRNQRPQISSDHVGAILAFGRSLQDVSHPPDRLRALLELAVKREVGGWWSYALRVSKVDGEIRIQPLCPPAHSAYGSSKDPHISKSVLRAVLEGGEPVVANKLARMDRFQAEMTVSPDSAKFSAVASPMGKQGDAADILYVILPPDMGSVEWLMLISLAVEQYRHADAAWEARLAAEARSALDREMSLARNVQARTLPHREKPGELDWAVRFDPCLSVAGDYVDVIARDDGRVILLVADAAGKGMQAALITAGLHAIFQTRGRTGSQLSDVVAAADRYLKAFLPDDSFVTFSAILFDPRTGEGCCVNCGHPPMMVASASGEARFIEGGDNLPLGLCEGQIESCDVQIGTGDWILGYTDGLTEMFNDAGNMLGLNRVHAEFQSLCNLPDVSNADAMADKMSAWLDEFRGPAAISDDRTLLIARRT
jgi:serine phosphatase RsbU (regulator of sigma subunit)